eukprot:247083-Rhodomonas_salina.1
MEYAGRNLPEYRLRDRVGLQNKIGWNAATLKSDARPSKDAFAVVFGRTLDFRCKSQIWAAGGASSRVHLYHCLCGVAISRAIVFILGAFAAHGNVRGCLTKRLKNRLEAATQFRK